MNRRTFLRCSASAMASVAASSTLISCATRTTRRPELRITRIVLQEARGRRLTPVAPNAYAAYRGHDVREPVLRIQTARGLEGICHNPVRVEKLKPLLGLDAVTLFEWDGDRIRGAAPQHKRCSMN